MHSLTRSTANGQAGNVAKLHFMVTENIKTEEEYEKSVSIKETS